MLFLVLDIDGIIERAATITPKISIFIPIFRRLVEIRVSVWALSYMRMRRLRMLRGSRLYFVHVLQICSPSSREPRRYRYVGRHVYVFE